MTDLPRPTHARQDTLDTLRGVAILMVVAFHVSVHFPPQPWLGKLATLGNQGVQLFFLVSAITMCMMWEQRKAAPHQALDFYVRRFFRIAPPFWLAMLAYLGWEATRAIPFPPTATGWQQIALTASFLHAFSPSAINLIVPGGWSIGVEMTFYAVFPLLVGARMNAVQTLSFAFVSYLLLGIAATTWLEHSFALDPLFMYYSMLTQFPIFPIGMVVYRIAMSRERVDIARVAALVAGWLLVAFAGKFLFGLNARPFFWLQVFAFAAVAVVVIRGGLHLRALSFVGTVSYSMYLFHFAAIEVLVRTSHVGGEQGTPTYLLFLVLTLAMTIAFAKLSGLTVEKWSSDVGRSIVARIGGRAARGLKVS